MSSNRRVSNSTTVRSNKREKLTMKTFQCFESVQYLLHTKTPAYRQDNGNQQPNKLYSGNQSVNQSKVHTLVFTSRVTIHALRVRAHWPSQPIERRLTTTERNQSELIFHQRHHKALNFCQCSEKEVLITKKHIRWHLTEMWEESQWSVIDVCKSANLFEPVITL